MARLKPCPFKEQAESRFLAALGTTTWQEIMRGVEDGKE